MWLVAARSGLHQHCSRCATALPFMLLRFARGTICRGPIGRQCSRFAKGPATRRVSVMAAAGSHKYYSKDEDIDKQVGLRHELGCATMAVAESRALAECLAFRLLIAIKRHGFRYHPSACRMQEYDERWDKLWVEGIKQSAS